MATGWDQASTIAIGVSALATAGMAFYTATLASKTKTLSEAAEKEANAVVEPERLLKSEGSSP